MPPPSRPGRRRNPHRWASCSWDVGLRHLVGHEALLLARAPEGHLLCRWGVLVRCGHAGHRFADLRPRGLRVFVKRDSSPTLP